MTKDHSICQNLYDKRASVLGQAIARYRVVGKAFTTVALNNLNAKPTGN